MINMYNMHFDISYNYEEKRSRYVWNAIEIYSNRVHILSAIHSFIYSMADAFCSVFTFHVFLALHSARINKITSLMIFGFLRYCTLSQFLHKTHANLCMLCLVFTFMREKKSKFTLNTCHFNILFLLIAHVHNVALFFFTYFCVRSAHLKCQRPIQCLLPVTLQLAIKISAQTTTIAFWMDRISFQYIRLVIHRNLVPFRFSWLCSVEFAISLPVPKNSRST